MPFELSIRFESTTILCLCFKSARSVCARDRALSRPVLAQAAAVLTEMDGDGNGAIDLAEMREWFMDFEEGGGGLLGIALRNELDQALEVRGLHL